MSTCEVFRGMSGIYICMHGLYLLLLLLLVLLVSFGVIIGVCISVKEACWKVFIKY